MSKCQAKTQEWIGGGCPPGGHEVIDQNNEDPNSVAMNDVLFQINSHGCFPGQNLLANLEYVESPSSPWLKAQTLQFASGA